MKLLNFFVNSYISIDIGFRYIKVVQVKKDKNQELTVLNFGIGDTPKGCIKNGIIGGNFNQIRIRKHFFFIHHCPLPYVPANPKIFKNEQHHTGRNGFSREGLFHPGHASGYQRP